MIRYIPMRIAIISGMMSITIPKAIAVMAAIRPEIVTVKFPIIILTPLSAYIRVSIHQSRFLSIPQNGDEPLSVRNVVTTGMSCSLLT